MLSKCFEKVLEVEASTVMRSADLHHSKCFHIPHDDETVNVSSYISLNNHAGYARKLEVCGSVVSYELVNK